jgi:hypothetical protein
LNAVSRFDVNRLGKGLPRTLPSWVPIALGVLAAFCALLVLFQVFFRYDYIQDNGALWRVDRLTQQMCKFDARHGACVVPKFSTSTSTSTSLSTSTYVRVAAHRKKP